MYIVYTIRDTGIMVFNIQEFPGGGGAIFLVSKIHEKMPFYTNYGYYLGSCIIVGCTT